MRGSFLLQQLQVIADHSREIVTTHLAYIVVAVTESALYVVGQQVVHLLSAQLHPLLLLRESLAETQPLEVLQQVAGETHRETLGLLQGLVLQEQQDEDFSEQVLSGVEGELIEHREDVFSEEVDPFEALELHRVEKVEPALFVGVLPVSAVDTASVEVPPFYDLLSVA